MGSHTKKKRKNNNPQINFRVTPDEYNCAEKIASVVGLSVPAMAKILTLQKRISAPKIHPDIGREIAAELRKISSDLGCIGGNVNQIAKHINMDAGFDEDDMQEMIACRFEIADLSDKVKKVWQALN